MACPGWCEVEGCTTVYGAHAWSFGIAAAAMPSRGTAVQAINAKEAGWERDMPAYKTLREQGLQPKRIDGCGDLAARATTNLEIAYGKPLKKSTLRAFEAA